MDARIAEAGVRGEFWGGGRRAELSRGSVAFSVTVHRRQVRDVKGIFIEE